MRDLTNLSSLLDTAADRQKADPTYRFHGRKSPANRVKTPILNEAPTATVQDGVARLRIYEPIDSWGGPWGISALEFLEVLDQLGDDVSEIRLHINSPGGEVWEALAILNSLRLHPASVSAYVDGLAASSASWIATAADTTIMGRNSELMIHNAWGICIGDDEEMHSAGDRLGRVSDNIASIYADKAGGAVSEWRDAMRAETWYSADEAVAAGLADQVGDGTTSDQDRFDLKGVGAKYASRAEAPAPGARSTGAPVPDFAGTNDRLQRFQSRRHAGNSRRIPA